MVEVILKNMFFKFKLKLFSKFLEQLLELDIHSTKYACLFMDRIENDFHDSEIVKPWLWLRCKDDIFFIYFSFYFVNALIASSFSILTPLTHFTTKNL